jgi:hypothetical protein
LWHCFASFTVKPLTLSFKSHRKLRQDDRKGRKVSLNYLQ